MTNEFVRLAGSRACLVPLLLVIALVVGYLMGMDRLSPVHPEIAANQAPRGSVDVSKPLDKPGLPQDGDDPQDTRIGELTGDGSSPDGNTDAQKSSPSKSGKSKKSKAKQKAVAPLDPTPKAGRQALAFEIVVSHYNEHLDWLKPYAKQAGHVYHKGFDRGPPFEMYKWERLPNVGREAHTYLHHIIENYDNLADVTVFLQGYGSGSDKASCFDNPKKFFINAKRNIFCKKQGNFSGWDRIEHIGRWLQQLNSGKMRAASMTVGEFYTILFGAKPPPSVPRCLSGCFSATRDNLLLRPLWFYQKAIEFVNNHSNPEEAHYFERLWPVIINAS